MNEFKYLSMNYSLSGNFGDHVQSLAAEQHIPRVDKRVDRDFLNQVKLDEPHMLITNGWFSMNPETVFPFSEKIIPVFFGFHLTDNNETISKIMTPKTVEYMKRYSPIGCRDPRTQEIFESFGIETFYSRCLTQTFPTRTEIPESKVVFVVDSSDVPIPENLDKKLVGMTQVIPRYYSEDFKYQQAKAALTMYREHAAMVVTSRIHCAMPCAAMGIPVVFFGDTEDTRLQVYTDIGGKIHHFKLEKGLRAKTIKKILDRTIYKSRFQEPDVDWSPKPLEMDAIKAEVIGRLKEQMDRAVDIYFNH